MKKSIIVLSILTILPVLSMADSIKLVNDTGSKVSVHTGSGVSNLNNSSSTSFSCNVGKKVYTATRGTKDKFLFKIKSSQCGNTVKLSSFM
jgi:hypothetical protein